MLFDPLLAAFLVIAIGFAVHKKIGFDTQSMANILIYVTGPALAFSSIYSKELIPGDFFYLGLAAIFIMLCSGLFAFIAFRLMNHKGNGMLLPAAFMNSGYLGFPIILFAFGELGLHKAIIFDAFATVAMFSIGIFLAQSSSKRKRERLAAIFKIPLIYAIVLGVALNYYSVHVPSLAVNALSTVGAATIPLALIALGGRLAQLKISSLKIPLVSVFSRLAVGAVAGIFFIKFFGLAGVVASVILLQSVMPPAINSYILNEKFGAEPENAATAVVLGTVLSIIPIGVALYFL
ncbi:MAG: AEC family transporter [archaeon]